MPEELVQLDPDVLVRADADVEPHLGVGQRRVVDRYAHTQRQRKGVRVDVVQVERRQEERRSVAFRRRVDEELGSGRRRPQVLGDDGVAVGAGDPHDGVFDVRAIEGAATKPILQLRGDSLGLDRGHAFDDDPIDHWRGGPAPCQPRAHPLGVRRFIDLIAQQRGGVGLGRLVALGHEVVDAPPVTPGEPLQVRHDDQVG